jgi:pimeloyl-ACP methyl ester carboxylesterase
MLHRAAWLLIRLAALLNTSKRASVHRFWQYMALSDTAASKHLVPVALTAIRAPTLIISARDDGYGTYASAQYTASQITGSKFVGYETGGHTWVGHDAEIQAEILHLLGAQR